jgi:cellulose synthase/poly-beta-1,6-N-acetylglucosamine synthase-like glycosyltransferase
MQSKEIVGNNFDWQKWPPVTIIIVTKGSHQLAERAVLSILAADYPSSRIQIVVLEETSNAQPITGNGVEYRTIPEKHLGVAFARNTALRYAHNDIIVFTDDDCTVDRHWLKEIVRPLVTDHKIAAVAGAVMVPPCGPIGRCENILGFPGGGLKYIYKANNHTIRMSTFSTCNCSINRKIFPGVHFEEGFMAAGEDELLSRAISEQHAILYNPRAVVLHQPRDSFLSVFRWFVKRGQARVEMYHHVGDKRKYVLKVLYTSPYIRLATVLLICICLKLSTIPVILLISMLYFISVLWRFRWSRHYPQSAGAFFLLPIVKTIMDFGMDTGVVKSLLKKLFNKKKLSVSNEEQII